MFCFALLCLFDWGVRKHFFFFFFFFWGGGGGGGGGGGSGITKGALNNNYGIEKRLIYFTENYLQLLLMVTWIYSCKSINDSSPAPLNEVYE